MFLIAIWFLAAFGVYDAGAALCLTVLWVLLSD